MVTFCNAGMPDRGSTKAAAKDTLFKPGAVADNTCFHINLVHPQSYVFTVFVVNSMIMASFCSRWYRDQQQCADILETTCVYTCVSSDLESKLTEPTSEAICTDS